MSKGKDEMRRQRHRSTLLRRLRFLKSCVIEAWHSLRLD